MAALYNRAGYYICVLWFLLPICFPRLFSAVIDWMFTTLPHDVASVQIYYAGLKCAARGSLKIQDAKNHKKFAIWAPSHNFVGLYLQN